MCIYEHFLQDNFGRNIYGSDAFLVYDDWYDKVDVHLAFKRLETSTEIYLRVEAAKLTVKTKRIQKLDTKRKEEKEKTKRFKLFQKLKEEFKNDE